LSWPSNKEIKMGVWEW